MKVNKDKQWAKRNYVSQRSLQHAESVRNQLKVLLSSLNIDSSISCLPNMEPLLKCLTSGLFLNAARLVVEHSLSHSSSSSSNITPSMQSHHSPTSKFSDRYHTQNKTVPIAFHGRSQILEEDKSAPYKTIRGNQPVHIHPSSVLFSGPAFRKLPQYVVYSELLITSKRYMRGVTAINGAWLMELNPQIFQSSLQNNLN